MKQHQQGSALIVAIFMVVVSALVAVSLLFSERVMVNKVMFIKNYDQAYAILQGPQIGSASVIDEQSKYNINNLVSPDNQWQWVQLLQAIAPELTSNQAMTMAMRIHNWLVPSQDDDLYSRLNPAYRAAHSPMFDVTELRTVFGMTAELYQKIQPYITALPVDEGGTAINVNTAMLSTWMTLAPAMTVNTARSIYNCRIDHGAFTDTETFQKLCLQPLGLTIENTSGLTTISRYFMVQSELKIAHHQLALRQLVSKRLDKNQWVIQIVWQSQVM